MLNVKWGRKIILITKLIKPKDRHTVFKNINMEVKKLFHWRMKRRRRKQKDALYLVWYKNDSYHLKKEKKKSSSVSTVVRALYKRLHSENVSGTEHRLSLVTLEAQIKTDRWHLEKHSSSFISAHSFLCIQPYTRTNQSSGDAGFAFWSQLLHSTVFPLSGMAHTQTYGSSNPFSEPLNPLPCQRLSPAPPDLFLSLNVRRGHSATLSAVTCPDCLNTFNQTDFNRFRSGHPKQTSKRYYTLSALSHVYLHIFAIKSN